MEDLGDIHITYCVYLSQLFHILFIVSFVLESALLLKVFLSIFKDPNINNLNNHDILLLKQTSWEREQSRPSWFCTCWHRSTSCHLPCFVNFCTVLVIMTPFYSSYSSTCRVFSPADKNTALVFPFCVIVSSFWQSTVLCCSYTLCVWAHCTIVEAWCKLTLTRHGRIVFVEGLEP